MLANNNDDSYHFLLSNTECGPNSKSVGSERFTNDTIIRSSNSISNTYPTDPQIDGLLLRLRLEETGTDGGTGRAAGKVACAGGAGTGTGGILNGDGLLMGV